MLAQMVAFESADVDVTLGLDGNTLQASTGAGMLVVGVG